MKKNRGLLVTFASWEERFRAGFRRDVERGGLRRALVLYFGEYEGWTEENRENVGGVCAEEGVECRWSRLSVLKPAENWRSVADAIQVSVKECGDVIVDISTMPREIIWYVLWLLEAEALAVRYVYHSPEKYGEDWLSRDPRAPRLVYKMSGIALPSRKTALVVTAGFDLQRAVRLIEWCEPSVLLVGLQSESLFARNAEAMEDHREKVRREFGCKFFELDAYGDDHGLRAVREQVEAIESSYNVIMSSLGPKLTAISLYRLQRKLPTLGLVYTPATEFSKTYSLGTGRAFWGDLGVTESSGDHGRV